MLGFVALIIDSFVLAIKLSLSVLINKIFLVWGQKISDGIQVPKFTKLFLNLSHTFALKNQTTSSIFGAKVVKLFNMCKFFEKYFINSYF